MSLDILIVGTGPTGLTAAIELARRGIKARVVDRDAGPTALSKAVGISPHSLDLLEPSGITERLLAEGVRIRRAALWSGAKKLADLDVSLVRHRFDFLLSLPQSRTEQLMVDRLGELGVTVERNTKVAGIEAGRTPVVVHFETPTGPQTADFDRVYGADGVHSIVREAAGIAFPGYVHQRLWSIADAVLPEWPYDNDAAQVFLHDGGDMGFIIPIGERRFRIVSNTPDALASIPDTAEPAPTVLMSDRFHLPIKQAQSYHKDNLFLGGDAAHVHSPIGARGMNLGIEDACCFVGRLVGDRLDGYTAERHPIGKRWIKLSERALTIVQADGRITTTLRDNAIRLMGRVPAMQRLGLERVAGLKE